MTLPIESQRGRLASRSRRLIAQLIDDAVAFVPALVIAALNGWDPDTSAVSFRIATMLGVAYIIVSDGFEGGQSLGKRIMDIAVIDVESGAPCTYGQSIARNLLLAVLGPIDWVFIFGDRHQRLGDKLARTMVVDQ